MPSFKQTLQLKNRNDSLSASSSDDEAFIPSGIPLSKLAPAKVYELLQSSRLNFPEMIINGYPMLNPHTVGAIVPETEFNRGSFVPVEESRRKCARCGHLFRLNPDGSMPKTRCTYHHRSQLDPQTHKRILPCCNAPAKHSTSRGCMVNDYHVFVAATVSTLSDFVTTPQVNGSADYRSKKVYGIDCELVYTLNGLEVARVSLVDMKGRVVLDTHVLPQFPILDYNTAFSGVEPKHLKDAISLEACRRQLFQFINESTLLVGHSLETDLKALRLCHSNVIDTAVLFAERFPNESSPRKPALRTLTSKFLQRNIQTSESGHCSSEDARACLDLLSKRFEMAAQVC